MNNHFLSLLFLLVSFNLCIAQGNPARIFFYSAENIAKESKGYEVIQNSQVIGRIKFNSIFSIVRPAGQLTFIATTESSDSIRIDTQGSSSYFLKCGLSKGKPTFELVPAAQANKEIGKINGMFASTTIKELENSGNKAAVSNREVSQDTIHAIQNLFLRKQKGGRTRAAVFGLIGSASLVGSLSSPQGLNGGSAILVGFCAIMTITGISNASSTYGSERMNKIIQDYKEAGTLPPAILSKLRKSDF